MWGWKSKEFSQKSIKYADSLDMRDVLECSDALVGVGCSSLGVAGSNVAEGECE